MVFNALYYQVISFSKIIFNYDEDDVVKAIGQLNKQVTSSITSCKYVVITLFFVFFFTFSFDHAIAQTEDFVIHLKTPITKYYVNEKVNVTGSVFNSTNGEGISTSVMLKVLSPTNSIIHESNFVTQSDGLFKDKFQVESSGTFQIVVQANYQDSVIEKSRTITVNNPLGLEEIVTRLSFQAPASAVVSGAIVVTIFSLWGIRSKEEELSWFNLKNPRGRAFVVAKFVLLSGLVFTPIAFLFFTPEPLGLGPIAIERHFDQEIVWFVNIGGITIPFLVIVLSLLGAHIRYLWDFYQLFTVPKKSTDGTAGTTSTTEIGEDQTQKKPLELYRLLWKSIGLFFLTPLLAIASYFVLVLGGTTNLLTIGLFAIGIGLTTENVVNKIIGKVKGTNNEGNNS